MNAKTNCRKSFLLLEGFLFIAGIIFAKHKINSFEMKTFLLHILLLAGFSSSFAQSHCTVKKAYAFYNVSMPGAQMADEHGNPIPPKANITRFIYVEYSGTKMPDITSVLYNNTALDYTVIKVIAKIVSIGDKKLNPNNTITAKRGNTFLQITLQPFEGKAIPDADCKSIIIKSKIAGKLCKFYCTGEKQFATLPRY
jgi:hypothetical protein